LAQNSSARKAGIVVTTAVAAFTAFSLSLPSGLFHKQASDLSLISRAVAAQEAAKPNLLAITSKELRGYLDQAKKILDPVEVLKFTHEVFKFDGGKLGLAKAQNRLGKPKTPSEIELGKTADCSEVAYALVSFLSSLNRKDIEVGAIFGHVKDAPEAITHIVPAANVGGKLIIIDPFSSFGRTVEFDGQQFQKAEFVEGNYYREVGDFHRTNGNSREAIEAYKEAVTANPKDNEARGFALNLLFAEFNKVKPNLKPENKTEVTKGIEILEEILFFMPASDPQRARLDKNLQVLKSWVQN
jgi:tetratricopeptide (TPR) repeat protein